MATVELGSVKNLHIPWLDIVGRPPTHKILGKVSLYQSTKMSITNLPSPIF